MSLKQEGWRLSPLGVFVCRLMRAGRESIGIAWDDSFSPEQVREALDCVGHELRAQAGLWFARKVEAPE
jgi:hypothetical protein